MANNILVQSAFRSIVKTALPWIAQIKIFGYENLPREGNFIVVANHLGMLDPALMYYLLERNDIVYPVNDKYEKHPLFGPFIRSLGGVFINRITPNAGSIREILTRMKKSGVLVITPEGMRSETGGLQQGKAGVAVFANQLGLPITPMALTGTEDKVIMENLQHIRSSHITLNIGKNFILPSIKNKDRDAALSEFTDDVMCHIAALLPVNYRGIYSDHHRLKELLKT